MKKLLLLAFMLFCLAINGQSNDVDFCDSVVRNLVIKAINIIETIDEAILKRNLCTAVIQVSRTQKDILNRINDCQPDELMSLKAKYEDAKQKFHESCNALGDKFDDINNIIKENNFNFDQFLNFWKMLEWSLNQLIDQAEGKATAD